MWSIGFVVLILTITHLVGSDVYDETKSACFCSDECSGEVCIQVTNDGCVTIGDDVNVQCWAQHYEGQPIHIAENGECLDEGDGSKVTHPNKYSAALNFQASPGHDSSIFCCNVVYSDTTCGKAPKSPTVTMHLLGDLQFKGPCNASQSIVGNLNVSCELVNVSEHCTDKLVLVINPTSEEIGPCNYTWEDDDYDVLHFSIATFEACNAMIAIRVSNTTLSTTYIDCDSVPTDSTTPTNHSTEPAESNGNGTSDSSAISGSLVFVMVGIIANFIIAGPPKPHRDEGDTHHRVELSNPECTPEQNGLHSQQERCSPMSKRPGNKQEEGTCSIPSQPIVLSDNA